MPIQKGELGYEDIRKIWTWVILDAVNEVRNGKEYKHREEAAKWLMSEDCSLIADWLGISHSKIVAATKKILSGDMWVPIKYKRKIKGDIYREIEENGAEY